MNVLPSSMTDVIRQRLPELLPDAAPIAEIHPVSESRHHAVWKVLLQDGTAMAVKYHLFAVLTRGKPFDLLAVEQKTSAILRAAGCPAPRVLAADAEYGLTLTQWCGDRTLDDLCQTRGHEPVADRVLHALLSLESAFRTRHADLVAHVAPGGHPEEVLSAWRETAATLSENLNAVCARLTGKPPASDLGDLWAKLTCRIANAPLSLGPTDYNARNIVLSDTGQPHVLELAKIGFDWPERRLVQYTTSLGANRADGQLIGLLTPERAQRHMPSEAALLDAHHLAFHLFAAQRCLAPQSPWSNRPARLDQIKTQLRLSFSANPLVKTLRTRFSA